MKEDNKGLKQEGFTPNGRFDDCKENKTIEHRAKEYLDEYCKSKGANNLSHAIINTYGSSAFKDLVIECAAHAMKQELSNALPSDEEISSFADEKSLRDGTRDRFIHDLGLRQGGKWLKQQILNNIK